jgi:transcriptional regulator with XRE-family HTH domain
MDLRKLGLRIKDLRTKRKLTQDKLSELTGMNGKHLGEVERGIINISIQNLDKIAESLGVSLLTLLDVEHHKSKAELSREIAKIVEDSTYEQVQIIHRVVTDITH